MSTFLFVFTIFTITTVGAMLLGLPALYIAELASEKIGRLGGLILLLVLAGAIVGVIVAAAEHLLSWFGLTT